MILAISCLLFQLPVAGHSLPLVVSQSLTTTTVQALDVRSSDALPDAPSSHASSNTGTAATDSNATGPVYHATAADPSSQNSQSLSTLRVPQLKTDKSASVISAERLPSRRNWLLLSLAQHSAATLDAYSTRRAIAAGAVEADPLMRPFASSPGIYAAIHVCPLGLDYLASRMQRSQNHLFRRAWWAPQAASTSLFLFSGAHNLRVAR